MALFNDQRQQQQEEQQNQLQQYGVCVGTRRVRTVQRVPYVPDMSMGGPLFRARQFPVYSVREQQHAMLQDRPNQDMLQHNIQHQDNIAYNPRPYQDQQQVIQGIRDFGGQLVRAMKGISLACVLYSKLLLHGVHVDLERLQSKKTAAEQEALSFDKENVEESFQQTLESRVHAWLVDVLPRTYKTRHQIGHIL